MKRVVVALLLVSCLLWVGMRWLAYLHKQAYYALSEKYVLYVTAEAIKLHIQENGAPPKSIGTLVANGTLVPMEGGTKTAVHDAAGNPQVWLDARWSEVMAMGVSFPDDPDACTVEDGKLVWGGEAQPRPLFWRIGRPPTEYCWELNREVLEMWRQVPGVSSSELNSVTE